MKTVSAQRLRRTAAIRGYIGTNGSGKTATAVADVLPSLAAGRPVLSAVRLLDWTAKPGDPCLNPLCDVLGHGEPSSGHMPSHPGWIPLRDLSQLLDIRGADVLLDEVGALMSSRESQSMPFQIAALLQQCRKLDLTVSFTCPAWGRADKILREVATLATVCHGFGSKRHPERLWSQRRFVHAVSYHAADLDDFEIARTQSVQSAQRPRKQASQWYRLASADCIRAYDTFEPVPSIGHASAGTCVRCYGRRAQPKCTCDDQVRTPGVALREDSCAVAGARPAGRAAPEGHAPTVQGVAVGAVRRLPVQRATVGGAG